VNRSSNQWYPDSLARISPFSSSICQEVSCGAQSVFSSSSNLNSPTPQEQSGVIVGAEEEVGIKETDGDVDGADDDVGTEDGGVEGVVDGVEDGEMEGREEAEGFMDGGEEEVGLKDGIEVGIMVGGEDNVGLDETDGTAEGTPRLGSHGMSILSRS